MNHDFDTARRFSHYCTLRLRAEKWEVYADEWWLAVMYMEGLAYGYDDAHIPAYFASLGDDDDTYFHLWLKNRQALFDVMPEDAVRSIVEVHKALDDEVDTEDPLPDLAGIYASYKQPFAIMLAIYAKLVAINHPDDVEEDDALLPDDF